MKLVYFAGVGNFGDELNRVLWPQFAPGLFDTADGTGFLGIGTIIGMPTPGCDFLNVFTSGVGYDNLAAWTVPHRVWCVRGPLTARMLAIEPDNVLTDGGILTPWVLHSDAAGTDARTVGVMPHWESMRCPGWREACDLAGFTLINPIGEPEAVVRALHGMRLVITESLHGAIIADSYGIPWVPIRTSGNFSVFKWMDWCLSMDVPLTAVTIPPPSLDALLHFGRPRQAGWGECVTFSPEDAIAEFDDRTRAAPAPAASPGLRRHAGTWLRGSLTRSASAKKILSVATGYRPARTAAHLVRAAQAAPHLSRPALRNSLRDRMLERLCDLNRAAVWDSAA